MTWGSGKPRGSARGQERLTDAKRERWILANESMATASVPGQATHWRKAQALPELMAAEPRQKKSNSVEFDGIKTDPQAQEKQ